MSENEKNDVGAQYPNLDELETYLDSPEMEVDKKALNDAKTAKTQLKNLGIAVPTELQEKINELKAKNPITQLPEWVGDDKWIEGLESRKQELEKGLSILGDNTTAFDRKRIEGQIANCTIQLEIPQDQFGGVSRVEYAKRARAVLGLKDENELENVDVHKGLEKIVEEQYESAVEVLKVSGLLKDSDKNPSKSKVENLLKNNISPEQFEVIKRMEKPTLQLVPKRTCAEYVIALNKNKPMPNQKDVYISDWTKEAFERADKKDNAKAGEIKGYRVVITEGVDAPAVLPGDDVKKEFKDRIEWFKNDFVNKGILGIDIKSYMLLQMAGFAKTMPRPVDDVQQKDETWTMLNGEDVFNGRVAGGDWDDSNRQVNLDECDADYLYIRARFRASVMVDVI